MRLVAALVGLLLVGGGIGWLVYIHHYQPVRSGSYGGVVSSVRQVSDGFGVEAYLVLGPAGTVGTMIYSLANDGPFDVTVTGPGPDAIFDLSYRWGPPEDNLPDTVSEFKASRQLPVTLKSHQQIKLFVSVTKQKCSARSTAVMLSLPVEWKALGVHHSTIIPLDEGSGPRIADCFEQKAVRLTRF